jgi:CNT family concentrative nucleoside transporter
MVRFTGLAGLAFFMAVAWALSSHRKSIHWRTIGWAMGLQWVFAVLVLRGAAVAKALAFLPWPRHLGWGVLLLASGPVAFPRVRLFQERTVRAVLAAVIGLALLRGNLVGSAFAQARSLVAGLMAYAQEGAAFVFGPLATPGGSAVLDGRGGEAGHLGLVFAFVVLPTIIFISSLFAVLYHLGVMPWVVGALGRGLNRVLKVSGAESLAVSASILMGQTEAPLTIRPFLAGLTRSELMLIMTAGMAHVSGSIMVAYVQVAHVDVVHLLTAVFMTAPGAILVAKLMEPETGEPATAGAEPPRVRSTDANVLDAASRGASEGLQLALNVAAMLIAFIALIALVNGLLKAVHPGWSLELFLGLLFRPVAFLMGVPWRESGLVGSLLGQRMAINEFVAFMRLGNLPDLGARARLISTFALCGFANFSSIAIQVGGIGALVPERRGDLAKLGLKAMVAGTLANFMSACIAGVLG